MLEVITKYWVEWLMAAIAGGLVWAFKRVLKSFKQDYQQHDNELLEKMDTKLVSHSAKIDEKMTAYNKEVLDRLEERAQEYRREKDEIRADLAELKLDQEEDKRNQSEFQKQNKDIQSIFKGALLSMQGDMFKNKCKELLKPDHTITVTEYENLVHDHNAYNALGGNHDGDAMFETVQKKYLKSL